MELIDSNELFRKFETHPWFDNADRDVAEEILLYEAPVIDAVPVVHGHWFHKNGAVLCSCCNTDKFDGIDADVWCDWDIPYCPHCGARMDEVE